MALLLSEVSPTRSPGLGPLVPLNFLPHGMGARSASPGSWSYTSGLPLSRGWVLIGTVGADEPLVGHKESSAFPSKDLPH